MILTNHAIYRKKRRILWYWQITQFTGREQKDYYDTDKSHNLPEENKNIMIKTNHTIYRKKIIILWYWQITQFTGRDAEYYDTEKSHNLPEEKKKTIMGKQH